MKAKIRLIAFVAALFPLVLSAWPIPNEVLHYSVRFKWGLIDANVGIARISTYNIPGEQRFIATLSGKSVDLLGHYYEASDTVTGSIMSGQFATDNNERIYKENGQFSIETITYNAQGPSKEGKVVEHLPDGQVIRSRTSNYGSGLTIDLLSVFYYMRQINYADYSPGQTFRINLSNGVAIENLNITYAGKESVESCGNPTESFHITLTFSSAVTSKIDNMDVWIANDDARTPLIVNGSLSVGHMECRFLNAEAITNIPTYND